MTVLSKIDIELLERGWINHKGNKERLSFLNSLNGLSENEKRLKQNLENVTQVIDSVYEDLDDDLKAIVDMRYWDKSKYYDWEEIADELFLSRSKVLRKRNLLLKKTADLIG